MGKDSAINGENNLTKVVLANGLDIDCLQMKFSRDKSSNNVNGYRISSRPWSYEDISITPFETVFYKTYWDSALPSENGYECPFEQRYTEWIMGNGHEYTTDVYPLYKLWKYKWLSKIM